MVYRLREIRKERGLTQEALSKAAQVNRVNIAKYESGKCAPSLKSAEKIAKALSVTVDELIGEKKAG